MLVIVPKRPEPEYAIVNIKGRLYRTDCQKSEVSGRLLLVQYLSDRHVWKDVKNPSRRDEVLAAIEPF